MIVESTPKPDTAHALEWESYLAEQKSSRECEGEEPARLHTLTSLRFFAAAWVMLFHVVPKWAGADLEAWPGLLKAFSCGYVSVAFFYVLSGFVLCHTYYHQFLRGTFHTASFLRKRVYRLAPVFYLSLIIGAPLFWVALTKEYGARGGISLLLTYLMENLLFLGAWWPPGLGFNYPAWSISVEMMFYLIFPWMIARIARIGVRGGGFWLATLFFTGIGIQTFGHLMLPELALWAGDQPQQPTFTVVGEIAASVLHTNPLVHLPEFAFGVILCRLKQMTKPTPPAINDILFLAVLVLLVAVTALADRIPHLILNSSLLLPVIGVAIWAGAGSRSILTGWLESGIFLLLGEASYALYILHVPLRDWLAVAVSRATGGQPGIVAAGLFCIAVVIISVLVFWLVERPAQRWLNSRFRSQGA